MARHALSLNDFEPWARDRLPRALFAYVSGGVEDNLTIRFNAEAYDRWMLRTRVLADISRRDMSCEIFGRRFAAPFGVAPMGAIAMGWPRADLALAKAAAAENIPFVLSGAATTPLEHIPAVNPNAWFQAYLYGNEKSAVALVERVKRAGYGVLVATVDVPVLANRENNRRAGFTIPIRPSLQTAWDGLTHPGWLLNTFLRSMISGGLPVMVNMDATRTTPMFKWLPSATPRNSGGAPAALPRALNWAIVEKVREIWPGKLVIKGILTAEDAKRCAAMGADGVIVSNHGGRQLDGAVASLAALPEVAAAAGNMVVMMDGGIRRGTHVMKALALGAKCVFIGRPMYYATSCGGGDMARHAMRLMTDEIDRNMAMMGLASLAELNAQMLVRV